MLFTYYLLLVALLVAASESALQLPSYLKPCSRNDPKFDECVFKNGKAAIPFLLPGDPKYKIPVIKPLTISELRVGDDNQDNRPTGLKITFKDLLIHGLDRAQLKSAHISLQDKNVEFVVEIPELPMEFQYEIDGKILLLPIKGKGRGSFNMTDVVVDLTLKYDLVTKKDGLEYMQAGPLTISHKTTLVKIYLDNLFNGDKTLGETTNTFLNENWMTLNDDVGTSLAQGIGEVIKQIVVNVMDLVPYNNVFPEKV